MSNVNSAKHHGLLNANTPDYGEYASTKRKQYGGFCDCKGKKTLITINPHTECCKYCGKYLYFSVILESQSCS